MMKTKGLLISLIFVASSIAGVTAAASPKEAAVPITLKVSIYQPATHMYAQVWHKYEPIIEEVTGGRVKMKVFDSQTLVQQKGANFYVAAQEGVCDIAWPSEGAAGNDIPLLNMDYLPIWRDFKGQTDACDGGLQEIVEAELHERGYKDLKVLAYMPTGLFMIATKNKEIRVPGDLKGLKMRSSGIYHRIYQLCGASPTNVQMGEVYEAVQKGMIDGSNAVITQLVDWKWMEVCNHLNMFPLGGANMSLIINRKVLDKMPVTTQKQVLLVLDACTREIRGLNINKFYYDMGGVVRKHMKIYSPTAEETKIWQETLKPLTAEWLKKAGPRGQAALDLILKHNR